MSGCETRRIRTRKTAAAESGSLSDEAARDFFFRAKGEEEADEREEGALTLRAKLKGNVLWLWQVEGGGEAGLLILERVMVELGDARPELPYPLRLSWSEGGSVSLSAFSEEERESWLGALSRGSRELLELELVSAEQRSSASSGGISGPNRQRRRSSTIADQEAAFKGLCANGLMRSFAFQIPPSPASPAHTRPREILCEEWMFESRLRYSDNLSVFEIIMPFFYFLALCCLN